MITNRQDQRTSITTKHSDDWKVGNIHYWLNIAYGQNDKADTLSNINASNGIVDADTYTYVLNPLQADGDKLKNLPGEIRDVDFITPIREKNIGEYLELPDTFTVKVNDPNISLIKNKEVADILRPVVEQAIINKINEQQETGVPSKDVGDISKLVETTISNWIDSRAKNAQGLIEHLKDDNDYNNKIIALFNNWWCTEEVYIHIYIENGNVFFEEINPLYGYPISNGDEFVDDNDAFVIDRKISIDSIKEHYSEDLTSTDLKYLDTLIDKYDSGSYSVKAEVIQDYYGRKTFADDIYNGNIPLDTSRDIRESILYFKTEVKRRILYKQNAIGEVVNEIVEKGYIVNEELGDIEIKNEWITEVWKQVLLGQDYVGIYLNPEPLDVQIYDNKGKAKLPIVGKKGVLNNVYVNPIPKRIIPNLALYRIITLQIERQMAKYKGVMEIIPASMLEGVDGDAKANMWYKLADNTLIYDDSEISPSTVKEGYRLVGNDGAVSYIKALIDLREVVKNEAWDMANMNDSRYGNAPASATVTNNQQNIFRARLGSMLMVTTFNNIKVKLFTQLLEYSKAVYGDGINGSNFNSEGGITYYNINAGELTENQYGVYVSNSMLDYNKLKEYKDLAFSAAQNGEFEIASKAIDSDNVSEIRTHIDTFIKTRDTYNKELEANKMQQEKAMHDEVLADKEADRQIELEKIRLKAELEGNTKVQLESMKDNSN